MDYLEFIARVTSHIPDKGQVMIRYYGLYSNAHRGKMRKARADAFHTPIIEDTDRHVSSKGWAEMILESCRKSLVFKLFPFFSCIILSSDIVISEV